MWPRWSPGWWFRQAFVCGRFLLHPFSTAELLGRLKVCDHLSCAIGFRKILEIGRRYLCPFRLKSLGSYYSHWATWSWPMLSTRWTNRHPWPAHKAWNSEGLRYPQVFRPSFFFPSQGLQTHFLRGQYFFPPEDYLILSPYLIYAFSNFYWSDGIAWILTDLGLNDECWTQKKSWHFFQV